MNLWPLKIIVKLVLAGVPFRHKILRDFGIFKHGNMDDISYAHKIFTQHAKNAFPDGMPEGLTILELGPGDSVMSGLMGSGTGAAKIYLADAGSFATEDLGFYRRSAEELRKKYGVPVPSINGAHNFEQMLSTLRTTYLTNGLAGLESIPDNSVDYIWSHSVLEHVRKKHYADTMKQLARILKPSGIISHSVDLMDHLNRGLNNLRFSEKVWENEYFAGAGFYTNRIGYTKSIDIMREAGLKVTSKSAGRWPEMPISRQSLNEAFKDVPDEELRVRTYKVLLGK